MMMNVRTRQLVEAIMALPATDGRVIGLIPLAEQAKAECERSEWLEAELDRVRERAEHFESALSEIAYENPCNENHPPEMCNCAAKVAAKALQ